MHMKEGSEAKDVPVFISYRLEGEEAELFLRYKGTEFIKNNAEAARKLMLERLHEVTRPDPATTHA